MILNYLLAYACYLLGAALFFLDVIAKYKRVAEANPNPDIEFNAHIFWQKEWVNIIKILLLGIATMILLIPLGGISVTFNNINGGEMFTTSVKVLFFPMYFVIGYTGGRGTLAIAGVYKKELYNKVGITDDSKTNN